MIGELTNHVWQSTLFAAAAGLLTAAFRKNRAQVRYWLWFSASLKFFVPFALLINLGGQFPWRPARTVATQITAPAVTAAMEQIAQPFTTTLPPARSMGEARDWLVITLFGVWACGFAGIAWSRLRDWRRIRAVVRASIPRPAQAGIPVPLRSSPGLLEPGIVGVLRPVLLLPADIGERLTPRQLEAVLAHELCHVHRRDNLFSAIHMMVEAAFWFHPMVWWIGARLVEERERACDEEVLRLGSEPLAYAEGILNVCKLYVESPLVCVSGVTGSDLKKRIHAILTGSVAGDLSFARRLALAIAFVAALALPIVIGMLHAPALRAQSTATSRPKFEVASIKPCKNGELGGGRKGNTKGGAESPASSPGRLSTACQTVENLIRFAYVINATGTPVRDPSAPPVEGGPSWIHSESYQINARAEGAPSQGMMEGPIMQTLLEDRFQLKIHRETREVPVYAVTVAKGGPKLSPFQEGSCIPRDIPSPPPTPEERGQKFCSPIIQIKGPDLAIHAKGATLDSLFRLLYVLMDRPIIDRTGIKGRFDMDFEFARPEGQPVWRPAGDPPPSPPAEAASEPAGPSIFTVFEKELGLKLEPAKGPRDFFVIDRVERPSGN